MKQPSILIDEARRMEELRRYAVLDTLPENALDELAQLAAVICETPISLISLVDADRQWFKSRVGFAARETSREISFCGHTILQSDLFIVPDTKQDERFAANPLVTAEPHIGFYAGASLLTPSGQAIGTLCVMDRVPRELSQAQQQALRVLSRQVMSQLELRRRTQELAASEERLRLVTDNVRVGLVMVDRNRRYVYANRAYAEILALPPLDLVGRGLGEVLGALYDSQVRPRLDRAFAGERVTYELERPANPVRYYAVRYEPTILNGEVSHVVVVIIEITERKQAEEKIREAGNFANSIIGALSAHLCVIDEHGTLLATNRAWGKFAEANPPAARRADTGDNYLQACDQASGSGAAEGAAFAAGIRAVLRGEKAEFVMEYDCHSPTEQRWFQGRVSRFASSGRVCAVVAHENITGRIQAASASLRLAAIVESSDDAIVGKDLNGIVTSWNRSAEVIFGYTAAEMLGASIMCLLPPERRDEETQILAKIRLGERIDHFETQRLAKGGRRIDVSVTISPIRDSTGNVIGVSKVARDITEEKLALAAREASEARYRALFEYAPDGIVIADANSVYLDVNTSICRMLGYTRQEMIGLHAADIVVAEEIQHIETALNVIKAKADYHREWRFRRKDGSTFVAEVIATLMPDGNLLGMIRDVTERKRTEARFRRLVDSNAQGVVFWTKHGGITGANDAFLHIVGYTRAELEAGEMNLTAMTPPEYVRLDRQAQDEITAKGVCRPYEKEFMRKDGARVTILLGAAVFQDNPDEGIAYVLDLTKQKKLEQQFLRAQRMESIGTLAGGIAHDLNNLLAPITMGVGLLKMYEPGPRALPVIETIERSANRGVNLVKQVLSFARGVEGSRVALHAGPIMHEIESIAANTFPKNITLRVLVPKNLWLVLADATQINQVLLNLCVNARDAMPDGGQLELSAGNVEIDEQYAVMNRSIPPGRYVLIQLTDTGTGMSKEVVDRIFEPFFTTKAVGQGTGLGLSTVLGIVRSHGGHVNVYSELGKGSTFKVYLPAESDLSVGAHGAALTEEMPRGNGELILVVDDEASILDITKQTLQAFGYRVMTADDGAQAIGLYALHRDEIAVVVTDMMMPVMDGPALIAALRRIPPTVRIIAASGLNANGNVARAASAGVKHFLPKPYSAGAILSLIKKVLAEDKGA
jgi:PAS domain S-box-containing protein